MAIAPPKQTAIYEGSRIPEPIPTTLVVNEEDLPADAEGSPEETVLMKQPFIRDGSKSIEQLVKEAIAATGENIRIRRFARFELGQ